MSDLTLYVDSQYSSPWAMSVFVALREKGLPFEQVPVDLDKGEQRDMPSLTHRVPTLVHGNFSLTESTAITEYLETEFPEPALYPKTSEARARARQIQSWIRSDLLVLRQERSTIVVFYEPNPTPLSAEAQAAAQKLFDVAERLLAHGGEHVFAEWTLVDLDLTIMLNRLLLNGDAVPPRLVEYACKQWSRPSVQEWVNQPRPAL
ncbi:Glutathione S-transferase YfcF [Ephemeroptericola cinctiostellae]|uniref:Glutathione S-transferase YfcF n=1 Tax=Ephemeroptericola cinctiostellae TaxID=2268024 RepID=A0A345DCS5_9BURK|nr:glutathione transferase [Ephemeroptericola cinctiostellae]AXF86163.1 Glutathione S-transferase YfcF [Ephemeroptericola cinctiostellae]